MFMRTDWGGDSHGTVATTRKKDLAYVWATFFLICAAVLLSGYIYHKMELGLIQKEKYELLSTIAEQKSRLITSWLQTRRNVAWSSARSPFFRKGLQDLLTDPLDTTNLSNCKDRLEIGREAFGYDDAAILDGQGQEILLSAREEPDPIAPETHKAIQEALASNGPTLSEIYRSQRGTFHLDILCPVLSEKGNRLALLLLRVDVSSSFFAMIQEWPTPSPSAETLLVRRDGENALFLNELRHRPGSALSFRIPLTHKEVPAVAAIQGKTGMFRGKDYRGVEVLADLRPVQGTSWFLVTKVDTGEILDEAMYKGRVVALFVVMAMLLVGSSMGLWFRSRRASLWKSLYNSERALRLVEEQYRTTLYSIGDGVITTDAEGKVAMMNKVARDLTGWEEEEVRGRPLEEVFRILNEETRATVPNPVERVIREGHVIGVGNNTVLVSRDGTERPIAHSAAPVRDAQGRLLGVVLIFRDQTQERARQRELARSHKEWKGIFEALGHPAIILDPHRNIIAANSSALSLAGLPTEEVLGRKCYEVFHKTAEPHPRCPFLKLHRHQTHEQSWGEEILENGRTMLVSLTPVLDEEGRLEKIIHVATDITELKAAQDALRESEERYRAIFENSLDPIGLLDQNMNFVACNQAFCSLFGYTYEELLGNSVRILHSTEESFQTHWEKVHAEIQRSGSFRGEESLVTRAGKPLEVEVALSVIEGPGGSIGGYLTILRDVTEHRKNQEEREKLQAQLLQAQKMEAVGRLAGGVAHDFNNMLSVIGGYTELTLSKLSQGDPLIPHLKEILRAAEHSANLVKQLLAFARKQVISPGPLDLNEIVEGMLKMLRRLIGENIELIWMPGHGLWKVYLDPTQVDQILANLMVNARDAIAGIGKITIETANVFLDEDYCKQHQGFAPGHYVMMAVSDDGCGMDRDTLEKIFEPFFTTKAQEKGTGLGLSTVYGIVKQNNGFINVYSEPGKGTTFRIYIPRHEGPKAQEEARRKVPFAHLPHGRETILLVEDEVSLLNVYRKFLEKLGYRVLSAPTPAMALVMAREHESRIDLLLTDVVMPQMTGKELWERLRLERPGLKCLFMSGYTANAIVHHGVLEEGLFFIAKPFSMEALHGKIRQVLEKQC